MGVAGLWEVLRPAGIVRSLTELAVHDGFSANPSRQRGFRIGIDASIWFFHAAYGREGENPELRTLFFRCCRLLQSPLLPLFVFDGPNRPAIKRGKRVGGNQHWLTEGMKNIIDAFGFEWWIAPGEAEAELAYLNRIGMIDAVLSDDVDNFLFGAIMVIRNPSNTLSGNRAHPVTNAQGKDDGNHVVTYTAEAILSDPSVTLSRSGAILIGLLSGGDYIPAGLPGCGQKFATGLARAGFGDSLVKAVKKHKGPMLDAFLDEWRQQLRNELKTNKSGLLPSKKPTLAGSLPDDFPSLPVLMSYVEPITSENTPPKGKRKTLSRVWRNDPDPMRIAALCELYFEWGVKDVIVQRFRTVLWPGIVCRAVRRVVMDEETHQRDVRHQDSEEEVDTTSPSSPIRQVSSALSALALTSPSKKSKSKSTTLTTSNSDSFSLSSLVLLTSTSPSSSYSGAASSILSTSSPLLLEVVSQRTHVSTDSILEYRVLVNPTVLVERAVSGVKGLRPPLVGGLFGIDTEDEDGDDDEGPDADESGDAAIERLETAAGAASKSGKKKKRKARQEEPTTPLRLWLPACMVRVAAPALVKVYEEKVRVREEKKAKRGTKGGRGGRASKPTGDSLTSRRKKAKGVSEGEDESESVPSASKTVDASKSRFKAVRVGGGGGGRRRAKQASEAQDDAYEFIDLSAGESPCSESDGEVGKTNTKGRGNAKTGPTDATKPKTKMNTTAAGTVNNFYKTTKSCTATRTTKSKPPKGSTSNLVLSKPIYEEEEESTDVAAPSPLPKSSRPLDLLRAKTKSSAAASNLTSKSSTTVPRYEEELSSSSSLSRPSGSKTSVPARPVTQTRKMPLFVDVSDTDSDVEVDGVRGSLYCATGSFGSGTKGRGPRDGDASLSVAVGGSLPARMTKSTFRVVDGVIDLTAKGSASGSDNVPSTSASTHPLSPVPLTDKNTDGVSPMNSDTALCTPTIRLASKLAHIFLSQAEEDDEGSEGDELPTFHRGSSAKVSSPAIARPALRPFPIQLGSDSALFPCASGLAGDDDEGDSVEIFDVFTIPRSPLPPRSPSPSPVKRPPVATVVKPIPPSNFPDNLTESESQMDAERQARMSQRRQVSPESDTRACGNEGNGILKSPRKSAAHSSPRHVCTREYASSSTRSPPPAYNIPRASRTCNDASDTWDGREQCTEGSRLSLTSGGIRRKPRPSDVSAIYISSGSDGEGDVELGDDNDNGGGNVEVLRDLDQDQDGYADLDGDGWADTAMILSVPPSPARVTAHDPFSDASVLLDAEIMPPCASKFKPAHVAPKANVRAVSAGLELELEASDGGSAPASLEVNNTAMSVPRPQSVHCAPLLVARAKRCMSQKSKDEDVIDLTSD